MLITAFPSLSSLLPSSPSFLPAFLLSPHPPFSPPFSFLPSLKVEEIICPKPNGQALRVFGSLVRLGPLNQLLLHLSLEWLLSLWLSLFLFRVFSFHSPPNLHFQPDLKHWG